MVIFQKNIYTYILNEPLIPLLHLRSYLNLTFKKVQWTQRPRAIIFIVTHDITVTYYHLFIVNVTYYTVST